MIPDVQLVKGQNRQIWHKNAIFCVQVVNSNYHKNRTRRRKNIPRTFLESSGPVLSIRQKILFFHAFLQPKRYSSNFAPNVNLHLVQNLRSTVWVAKRHEKTKFFDEWKVRVLSFPKTSLECFFDVWFGFYDNLNSPLERKKSHFCAKFDDFGP